MLRTISSILILLLAIPSTFLSQSDAIVAKVTIMAEEVNDEVIALREYFHEHPELSNREFETAKRIADECERLGLPIETGVAHTGVVAVLDSGKPGPTIGLRADIDGLPVTERTPVPYASTTKST